MLITLLLNVTVTRRLSDLDSWIRWWNMKIRICLRYSESVHRLLIRDAAYKEGWSPWSYINNTSNWFCIQINPFTIVITVWFGWSHVVVPHSREFTLYSWIIFQGYVYIFIQNKGSFWCSQRNACIQIQWINFKIYVYISKYEAGGLIIVFV